MKRTTLLFLLAGLILSAGFQSFGDENIDGYGKYEDAKLVLTDLAILVEGFVEKMNGAEEPEDIARVLNKFTESMQDLIPKIDEVRKKTLNWKTKIHIPRS